MVTIPKLAAKNAEGVSDLDTALSDLATGEAVAPVRPPLPPSTTRRAARDDSEYILAPVADNPREEPEAPVGDPKTCPSCGKTYPPKAKICTDCGIDLKTGQALLTTQEDNLDQIYTNATTSIWFLSWIIWLGFYPVASEAFGLRKPWVVRGIAILTTLVSAWYMAVFLYNPSPDPALANLMLWGGRQYTAKELSADPNIPDEVLQGIKTGAYAYQPRQLFTHMFLHGGILHLAGNLLFLMVLGSRVNSLIGNVLTAFAYPMLGLAAAFAQLTSSQNEPMHPMLGASGAIMGLAGMYLIFFPVHNVHVAFWVRWGLINGFRLSLNIFPVRGFWIVLFYIAFDVIYTLMAWTDDVAHWAHLGGFIAGMALAIFLMVSRLVNARGADLLSTVLGRYAWPILGKPNRPGLELW